MSEAVREQVSALIDGELAEHEAVGLLNQLNRNTNLRHVWERYHLVRDVLSNNLPPMTSVDLVEQVRQSIEAEPIAIRASRRRGVPTKPLASLALAASIAVVAVVTFRGYLGAGEPDAAVLAHADTARESVEMAGVRWDVDRPQVEERLNAYLVNHNGHMGNGMRGMLPYARIVAYNGSR